MKNDIKCFCPKCNEPATDIAIKLVHEIALRWNEKENEYQVRDDTIDYTDVNQILCCNCLTELKQKDE